MGDDDVIDKKYQVYLAPVWLGIFFLILDSGLFYTLFMVIVIFIAAMIGYKLEVGMWGASGKSQFRMSKWLTIVWIGLIVAFWWVDSDLALWRQVLVTVLLLITAVLDFLDSYFWYKKEREQEADLQSD
ncbi:hypothetical protein [Alkalicoccobacillus plakortidis]|uniref:Uncharacterized protein n=1 Tax=Alkalicoccobacillus plakortidis TaxID=444060 RepID=A0ABT0XJ91_9BACI|nr:hypothetical protein [Alkalicoccobacillus plakortidis]MCM2675978.1 hypothetical protein [Alkalicoccobacillus plakortidis]